MATCSWNDSGFIPYFQTRVVEMMAQVRQMQWELNVSPRFRTEVGMEWVHSPGALNFHINREYKTGISTKHSIRFDPYLTFLSFN